MPRMNPDQICTTKRCGKKAITSNKDEAGKFHFKCGDHANNKNFKPKQKAKKVVVAKKAAPKKKAA